MKMTRLLTLGLAVAVAALAGQSGRAQQPAAELSAGDAAPAFNLPGSDGRTYSLDEFRGKRAVVLAWFPKAFTAG